MTLPQLASNGLLPPGTHPATLSEIEATFVHHAPGNGGLRAAVFAGVRAWLGLVQHHLGPGTCWVGGGFVSHGEADDRAITVFLPDDRDLAATAMKSESGLSLISLMGVVYSYPPPGGALDERWAVSGLVDAHLADTFTENTYQKALAAVQTPNGGTLPGVAKGIVEVVGS